MTKQQQTISVLILFCVLTFIVRMKLTQSFFLGFLLWNLFLAIIPYALSEWIKRKKTSKIKLSLSISIWLLFLPNAPYIITDFIHLHHLKSTLIWYDLYMIFCFAFTGLLLAVLSMDNMYKVLVNIYSKKVTNILMLIFTFLSGFGIYLGRFLRFNSWDIFTKPTYLFKQILNAIATPNAWYTSIAFGILLSIILLIFKTLKTQTK